MSKILGDKVSSVTLIPSGCEVIANKDVGILGDGAKYLQITPKGKGMSNIGSVNGEFSKFAHHVAGIKNNKVYDELTGKKGMELGEYKKCLMILM